MKLFRKREKPTQRQIREARPIRNPNLPYDDREDGTILLRVPLEERGGIYKLVSRYVTAPAEKQVELEEIGSYVWRLCDGKHTCEKIASKLKSEYKLTKAEAEASLISFLETLAQRRYLSLDLPKR